MNSTTATTYNDTSSRTNKTIDEINYEEYLSYLPVLVIYVFIMIVGIIGNIFVVIIYKLKFKRSRARIYILALAYIDLSVCTVGLPYHILDITRIVTYTMTPVCKTLSYLIGACTLSSVFVLLVVGLDRYLRVCRPLHRQIIDFGSIRACVIAVVAALILSAPNAIFYGKSTVTLNGGIEGVECFIDDYYLESVGVLAYLVIYLVIFVISVFVLVTFYGLICRTIFKNDSTSGEIEINNRTRLCKCTSPETDSIDSDHLEEDDNGEKVEMANLGKKDKGNKTETQLKTESDTGPSCYRMNCIEEEGTCGSDGTDDIRDENVTEKLLDNEKKNANGQKSENDKNERTKTNDRKAAMKTTNKVVSDAKNKSKRKSNDTTRRNRIKARKLHPRLKNVSSSSMMRHVAAGQVKKEKTTRKITLMMFTITVVFIISYLPFIVISILDTAYEDFWGELSYSVKIIVDFLLRFYLVNNMANPIIYSFWDKKFRNELLFLIKQIVFCQDPRRPPIYSNSYSATTRRTTRGVCI